MTRFEFISEAEMLKMKNELWPTLERYPMQVAYGVLLDLLVRAAYALNIDESLPDVVASLVQMHAVGVAKEKAEAETNPGKKEFLS